VRSKIDNWKALNLKTIFVVTKLPISHCPLPIESERGDARCERKELTGLPGLGYNLLFLQCKTSEEQCAACSALQWVMTHWGCSSLRDAHHHAKVTLKP